MTETIADLPFRRAPRPRTTSVNPHQQLEQNAPKNLQEALVAAVLNFPGVTLGDSIISGEGSRAFILDLRLAAREPAAFFGPSTEFAHIHRPEDGSLHAKLPPLVFAQVIEAGWGEPHPRASRMDGPVTNAMIYGPRDISELEIVKQLVRRSYLYATTGR